MPRRDFTVRHVKPKMPIKLDVLSFQITKDSNLRLQTETIVDSLHMSRVISSGFWEVSRKYGRGKEPRERDT